MTTQEKIEQACRSVAGMNYYFGDWTQANDILDNAPLPALICLLPAAGNFNLHNGQVRDYPGCMFAFVDKTDFRAEATQNGEVIERMKGAALDFIREVNSRGGFEPISGNVHYRVIYDKLDVNVTGVVLEITLKERRGICLSK